MSLDCRAFPVPRRHVLINPKEKKLVYIQRMNGGYVGFIDRITVTRGDDGLLGSQDTYVDFIIDGTLKERVKREISLNNPDIFNPPLLVKEEVIFYGYNGDTVKHFLEVVVDGQMCRPIERRR